MQTEAVALQLPRIESADDRGVKESQMLSAPLPIVEIDPVATPVAVVIWLHGPGADGRVPGEMAFQAATGSSKRPRQCLFQR